MHDQSWHIDRAQAERVRCTYCRAAPGETCTGRGQDGQYRALEHFPAHWCRIKDSENQ